MKGIKLTLIFGLLAVDVSVAQKIGIINNPDGFVNIRSGSGTNYEIIGKIEEGDQFRYFPKNGSSWWSVETIPYFGPSLKGFVHQSAIQPYYAESLASCTCPQPYNDDVAKPVLEAKLGNTMVSICGFLLQRQSMQSIKITAFTIAECDQEEPLRFYGAGTICQVSHRDQFIELIEVIELPLGADFEWKQAPFKKVKLVNVSGNLVFQPEQMILDLSQITRQDINSFVSDMSRYKNKGLFDETEAFIAKLLVCSLKGDNQCLEVFNHLEDFLNIKLSGHLLEFYNECKMLLEASDDQ